MAPTTDNFTAASPNGVGVGNSTIRLVAMLTDPSDDPVTLTRAQLAWLMASAQRWGYETRCDEENDEWIAQQNQPPVFQMGRWFHQADVRAAADAAARLPRVGDYHGGPIPWDQEQAA